LIEEAGTYSVTVTRTDTFCTAADRILVDYRPLPQVDLEGDTSLCFGESIWLTATFPEAATQWSTGIVADSILVERSGRYSATLLHPCGAVQDGIDVRFEDCREMYLPNAFSPNGDGVNDLFFPMDGGDVRQIYTFQIYDRWGALVFNNDRATANDPRTGWNGQYGGELDLAPPCVYAWMIDVEFVDGFREVRTGTVTLVR
jgi:gliding motility-associated-like protein